MTRTEWILAGLGAMSRVRASKIIAEMKAHRLAAGDGSIDERAALAADATGGDREEIAERMYLEAVAQQSDAIAAEMSR